MAGNTELFSAICNGKADVVTEIVQTAVGHGENVVDLLLNSMIPAMKEIGERFARNEVYVPEMLISARAMNAGLKILEPLLAKQGHKPLGRVAIGTVKGDLHDIGKNLVGMLMEGAGFQVIDLGIDVPSEKFVEAVKSQKPNVIGLSALLTTTMPKMKEVVESLVEAGIRKTVKVMVGGAPVTEKFARDIGADGYAPDAASAVEKARELIG